MMIRALSVALCLVLSSGAGRAQDVPTAPFDLPEVAVKRPALDLAVVRHIPVQHNERYKPFDSLAREWVREVTGKERFHETDPVLVFLSWRFEPERARYGRWIRLPDAKAAKEMGYTVEGGASSFVSWEELRTNTTFQQMVGQIRSKKSETFSELDKEVAALNSRGNMLSYVAGLHPRTGEWATGALGGYFPVIPLVEEPVPGVEYVWESPYRLAETSWPQRTRDELGQLFIAQRDAYLANDGAAFDSVSEKLLDALLAMKPEKDDNFRGMAMIDREVRLNRINPFSASRFTYFLAFCVGLLALPFMTRLRLLWLVPVLCLTAALGFNAWGVYERTVISGRAMIGTFYETMIFVSGACALFGIIFDCIYRRGFFVISSAMLASVGMWVAVGNPDFMNPDISELKPVLINNDLIHIHVPTIMTSYAALGLSFVLGQLYLLMYFFKPERHPLMKNLVKYMFGIIPVGVILLFAGMILGGVWADASWGRFWGWDPKEIASLITFLVYIVIVHGRWAGWLRDYGTALGSVAGGMAVLWTYYGANFFMTGKHAYAAADASKEFPFWLIIFLGFEALLVGGTVICWSMRSKSMRKDRGDGDGSGDGDGGALASHETASARERVPEEIKT
jgi:ABC-type transport system involved in cytochrome c biogenesis permease subunit